MKKVFQFIYLILLYQPITHAQSTVGRTRGESTMLHGPVKRIIVKRLFNKLDSKKIYELQDDTMVFDNIYKKKNMLTSDYTDFYFYDIINYLLPNGSINKSFPSVKGLKVIDEISAAEGEIVGEIYKDNYEENRRLFFKDEFKYIGKDNMYKLSRSNSKNVVLIKEDHIYFSGSLDEINFYKLHNKLDVDIMFYGYVYDKYGNWIRRTGARKSTYNIVVGIITETRNISYWE
jgi:hypothetical protein